MSLQLSNDIIAYIKIANKYNENYNELYDALYHYMNAYLSDKIDLDLYLDEIENLIGIRNHVSIVEYIIMDINDIGR